jgi:acyl transferase domain-containing protein
MSDQTTRPGATSQDKQVLLALRRLRARVDQLERARSEPIAIVGMGCRFPGGAHDPDSYWRLLAEGRDAIGEVPRDRFDVDAYYDPDPDAAGKISTRWGGYVDGAERFDAAFFGIAPREANSLDPQQRLVLEVAWEALEHAGVSPQRLAGSDTGVFVGISTQDYAQYYLQRVDAARMDAYFGTGNAMNAAAGRLSYVLGLNGPSMAVDTACSSSLVAIHLACESLRRAECGAALAGGVNFLLLPEITVNFSRARMMAPDGRCKTFDAAANGYVRGEGCGIVVLKTLRAAQAAGDRILAVIRGSATNQDGRSGGFTAPSELAQQALIRRAIDAAGVAPHEVDYVEAHGTGTSLGDPIEAQALAAALGPGRADGGRLRIGSVKTNIGHLEAAAGVAGLMKLVLALQHEAIPPHLHFTTPNPLIDWSALPIEVAAAGAPWRRGARRRIGGVSSFGFSGTNAHIVVEEAPAAEAEASVSGAGAVDRSHHVLAISAKSDAALRDLAARYAERVGAVPLADACFSANTGRAHFEHRLAVVGSTSDDVRAGIEAWVATGAAPNVASGRAPAGAAAEVAWIFPGQGAQSAGMARELYATQPTFRQTLDECAAILAGELDVPLLDVIYGAASARLDETAFTQPALFAVEYALANLWRSWGVEPAVVLGHSVGEYVAACVAGVFGLDDALRLVATRARLMQSLPLDGAMIAVQASESTVMPFLAPHAGRVSVAAINAADQTVLSGAAAALDRIVAELESREITVTRLAVSHAFHSPLVAPILDAFEQAAARVAYRSPRIPVISNVTGAVAQGDELVSAAYWRRQALAPVRFAASVATLATHGVGVCVEVGPKPTLSGAGRRTAGDDRMRWLPTLRPGAPDWSALAASVAQAYVAGVAIDWVGFDRDYRRSRVALPTYPFQRERYWIDAAAASRRASFGHADSSRAVHPLLDRRFDAAGDVVFESEIDADRLPFFAGHRIRDAVVLPASAYVEMVAAAAGEVLGGDSVRIDGLSILEPLTLQSNAPRRVQLIVRSPADGPRTVEVFAAADQGGSSWTRHATATVAMDDERDAIPTAAPQNDVVSDVHLPADLADESGLYRIHPALLDACIQPVSALLADRSPSREQGYVLMAIDRVSCRAKAGARVRSHVRLAGVNGATASVDLTLVGEDGTSVATLTGMRFRQTTAAAMLGSSAVDESLYVVEWQDDARAAFVSAGDVGAIAGGLEATFDARRREHDIDLYEAFLFEIDAFSIGYIAMVLVELGASIAVGSRLDPDALARAAGVSKRFERLWARLFDMLADAGMVAAHDEGWTIVREVAPVDERDIASLRERYPAYTLELDVFVRCAGRVAQVLRGGFDPLQLLFPNASMDAVEQLVEAAPFGRLMNGIVRDAIAGAVTAAGPTRPLRVLEIGAGTGGTSSFVLPILPADRTEYVFTDISPAFLSRARRKFADYPFVRYQLLDIEADPVDQQLSPASFDIVIAANVCHATRDLRATLTHAGRVLAPGGLLVLLEVVCPQRIVDLTFGLTDGWWRFNDYDLRREHPLLPRARWIELLSEMGFEGVTAVPGVASAGDTPQAVILGRAARASRALDRADGGERWMLVCDDPAVGEAACEIARRCGDDLVLASTVADVRARLDRDARAIDRPLRGVIYAADPRITPDDPETRFDEQVASATRGALELMQALIAVDRPPRPKLWIATRGSQHAGDAVPLAVAHAPLWGLGRTFAVEHPELWGGLVDLDAAAASPHQIAADLVEAAMNTTGGDDHIAMRHGRRHVARLAPAPRQPAAEVRFPSDAAYLITGGTGGMALEIADWMIDRGAAHVALVARRPPETRVADAIDRLRGKGARVDVLQADVARFDQLAAAFEAVAADGAALKGVIHCAGVFDDRVIRNQDWARFDRVLGPKVRGAWNLHQLTRSLPLDFFVMFSSTAAVIPGAGLSNYAAANAFLDALAHHRRAMGLPAVTVDWCAWAGTGMAKAVGQNRESQWSQVGMATITPAEGTEILGRLLSGSIAQCIVAPMDWATFFQRRGGAVPPIVSSIARRFSRVRRAAALEPAAETLMAQLERTASARRRDVVREHVRRRVAEVLGFGPSTPVDPDRGLFEIGMDSLTAVELKNLLQKSAGCTLPTTLVFDHPSVRALTDHLAGEVFHLDGSSVSADAPAETRAEADEGAARVATRAHLQEDELAAMLAAKLAELS